MRYSRPSPGSTRRRSRPAPIPTATASSATASMSAQVDPQPRLHNDDHKNLLRLDASTGGGMVLTKTLGEILAERGKTPRRREFRLDRQRAAGQPARAQGRWRAGQRLLGAGRARGIPDDCERGDPAPLSGRTDKGRRQGSYRRSGQLDPGRCCATTCCPSSSPTSIVQLAHRAGPHPARGSAPARREARASIRAMMTEVGLLLERLRRARARGEDQHHRGVGSRLRSRGLRRQVECRTDQGRAQGARRFRRRRDRQQRPDHAAARPGPRSRADRRR